MCCGRAHWNGDICIVSSGKARGEIYDPRTRMTCLTETMNSAPLILMYVVCRCTMHGIRLIHGAEKSQSKPLVPFLFNRASSAKS